MAVVAVAASGGRDSTALLHCVARAGARHGVQVMALHVHHGLMPQADAWQQMVRQQARRWGAGFAAQRLHGGAQRGDSVEAWARRARYAALADMARGAGATLVLLGHHRRDQVETWLLQALRGGGPRGLSAMPRSVDRDGLVWARPWLDMPRDAIEAYVQRHRLRCVDDDSNADPRFARSRLRHAVWPALSGAFGDAEIALAAAARQAQEAAALQAELASADLQALADHHGLHVQPWLALTPARRLNALRFWLATTLGQGPPDTLVRRLSLEIPQVQAARWPAGEGRELRLYRGRVALMVLVAQTANPGAPAPDVSAGAGAAPWHDFSHCGLHRLPAWGGCLEVLPADSGGIDVTLLRAVRLRPRSADARFQRTSGGLPRSLKLQFQSAAVPAWDRAVPLLFAADGRLLFVPGLGADARCLAAPGAPQRLLCWQPAAAA